MASRLKRKENLFAHENSLVMVIENHRDAPKQIRINESIQKMFEKKKCSN